MKKVLIFLTVIVLLAGCGKSIKDFTYFPDYLYPDGENSIFNVTGFEYYSNDAGQPIYMSKSTFKKSLGDDGYIEIKYAVRTATRGKITKTSVIEVYTFYDVAEMAKQLNEDFADNVYSHILSVRLYQYLDKHGTPDALLIDGDGTIHAGWKTREGYFYEISLYPEDHTIIHSLEFEQ